MNERITDRKDFDWADIQPSPRVSAKVGFRIPSRSRQLTLAWLAPRERYLWAATVGLLAGCLACSWLYLANCRPTVAGQPLVAARSRPLVAARSRPLVRAPAAHHGLGEARDPVCVPVFVATVVDQPLVAQPVCVVPQVGGGCVAAAPVTQTVPFYTMSPQPHFGFARARVKPRITAVKVR